MELGSGCENAGTQTSQSQTYLLWGATLAHARTGWPVEQHVAEGCTVALGVGGGGGEHAHVVVQSLGQDDVTAGCRR